MAVKIRLRRVGKRNAACHRIVVADGRSPRDGRFIENIGTYDPRGKAETIDLARADYWIGNGAQPSETVAAIIKRARAGLPLVAPVDVPPVAKAEAVIVEQPEPGPEPEPASLESDADVATEAVDEQA